MVSSSLQSSFRKREDLRDVNQTQTAAAADQNKTKQHRWEGRGGRRGDKERGREVESVAAMSRQEEEKLMDGEQGEGKTVRRTRH